MFYSTFSKSKKLLFLGLIAATLSFGVSLPLFADQKTQGIPEDLVATQDAFRQVSKNVLPSVVEILTTVKAEQPAEQLKLFDFPFGLVPDSDQPSKPEKAQALGSGVMIHRSGSTVYILTNNHVIDKAEKIQITLNDGRQFTGKVVGSDSRRDLALVSFQSKSGDESIVLAPLGNSDDLQVGDWVMAIGNPLGMDFTVTHGIVSALGRQGGPDGASGIDNYIQTDAPINRGNSGGALVNLKGELVGINTWIASPNGANIGLGFAIPINAAKKPIEQFISYGTVKSGWLGAEVSSLSKETAESLGLPSNEGGFISGVFSSSPAEKAGIQPGDLVTQINGKSIKDAHALVQTVSDLSIGESANFQVVRNGQTVSETVLISERAQENQIAKLRLWPGLMVAVLTNEVRGELKLDGSVHGVAVAQIDARSTADIAGIQRGDIITKVNDTQINNVAEFYRLFNAGGGEVKLTFLRQGEEFSIGISRTRDTA